MDCETLKEEWKEAAKEKAGDEGYLNLKTLASLLRVTTSKLNHDRNRGKLIVTKMGDGKAEVRIYLTQVYDYIDYIGGSF